MTAKLRSWWQKMQKHPMMTTVIIVVGVFVAALILVIVLGYWFNWSWVGVNGGYSKITTTSNSHGITTATEQPLSKTLWDWLQLLIIPLALAVIALVFQSVNTRTERQIAKERYEQDQQLALDKQREDLLQSYLDRMSELLLKENLGSSQVDAKVRDVARVRTITVLFQLDARRIGYVFAFLRQAGLMSNELSSKSIVNFPRTDLSKINLSRANLRKVDLREANLQEADFREANLSGANLSNAQLNRANLSGANLSEANLQNAMLQSAYLKGALGITVEKLKKQAGSLLDATMPDGSKYGG